MIHEGTIVKVAIAPAAVYTVAVAVPKIVHSGFEAVVFMAAALAALGYLGKLVRRGVRAARSFVARASQTFDIVESTPANFKAVHARLDRHREELIRHGDALDVMADADKHRIKDAVAGDERSPVDRRVSGTN